MRSGRIGDMGGEIETAGIRISILVSLSECLQTIFTVDKSKRGKPAPKKRSLFKGSCPSTLRMCRSTVEHILLSDIFVTQFIRNLVITIRIVHTTPYLYITP